MDTKTLYRLLKVRREDILKELAAIDIILKEERNVQYEIEETYVSEITNVSDEVHLNIPPKGNKTWKDYLLDVISCIGGEVKSNQIASEIVKANNNITFERARQAAADKLPLLEQEGKIKIIKGKSKKDGNTYILLDSTELIIQSS